MDINKELCDCFVDWKKALEHVKWTKLMHILKETETDWHKKNDQQTVHETGC